MAHIKSTNQNPYVCVCDENGNILTGSVESLSSHQSVVMSNADPHDTNLNDEQVALIGAYEIVDSDPPYSCERIFFVYPSVGEE